MRRVSRLEANGLIVAISALTFVAVATAEPVPPVPTERPEVSGDLSGNDPQTATDGLARLQAEIARQAKEQEQRAEDRRKYESQAADMQSKSIGLAAKVQDRERAISLSEDNLDVLNQRETEILARLKLGRAQLTDTLAALELLERQKPPALAVRPEDASDAVRSAILLSDIVPRLKAQADVLAKELKDLRLVRERTSEEHKTLAQATKELKENQAKLNALIQRRAERRAALGEDDTEETRELAELGRRAESLSALVEGLKEAQLTRPRAKPARQAARASEDGAGGKSRNGIWESDGSKPLTFADARGRVRLPVVGKVVEKFGVPNDSGGLTKGIKIGTRASAQVIAPFDGRVKYAGPLKSYGNVLIVEAEGEYLIILAGMTHVDAAVGQWLLAGEPIGRMADDGEDGPRDLYLEFRRAREPFDPLPWLAGVTKEG